MLTAIPIQVEPFAILLGPIAKYLLKATYKFLVFQYKAHRRRKSREVHVEDGLGSNEVHIEDGLRSRVCEQR